MIWHFLCVPVCREQFFNIKTIFVACSIISQRGSQNYFFSHKILQKYFVLVLCVLQNYSMAIFIIIIIFLASGGGSPLPPLSPVSHHIYAHI